MSQADIDAWAEGRHPASTTLPSLADCTDLRTIKLFSLNDYLGLSTHPAVRQAAANAALQCGNGKGRRRLLFRCHLKILACLPPVWQVLQRAGLSKQ
jgi:7-keto-8-aminopelargonate synthetase-like enzyme